MVGEEEVGDRDEGLAVGTVGDDDDEGRAVDNNAPLHNSRPSMFSINPLHGKDKVAGTSRYFRV